jgi:hypothetical protein
MSMHIYACVCGNMYTCICVCVQHWCEPYSPEAEMLGHAFLNKWVAHVDALG